MDDLGFSRPVIHAVTWQGREWVKACAQAQNNVCFGDQFHASLRAVISQRTCIKRVVAWERIVVLVAHANWCVERFGENARGFDAAFGQDCACAVQDHWKFRSGQQISRVLDSIVTALWQFKINDDRQFNVDNLCPEVARDVDLRWTGCALGLHDYAVQRFCDTAWIADFFLVRNTVSEQVHLFHLLETTLADCLVRSLWRHEQNWCVVPVRCFHGCYEVCDARTVLRDHHRHFAGGAGVAVSHHAAGCFVGAVPESNACIREDVGNWHHGRANDPECVVDAMHLERFDEGFFGGHFHGGSPFFDDIRKKRDRNAASHLWRPYV